MRNVISIIGKRGRSRLSKLAAAVAVGSLVAAILGSALFGTTQAATSTTLNLALGKPAAASSVESSSLTANLAVDSNSGTRWSSKWSDPQWIYVDLGQGYAISRVRLSWETAYAKAYQIQVSDDAVNWTTIYNTSTGTGGVNDLALSGNGRYVRMYGTARGTVWGYSLWRFEVYGSDLTSAPSATATAVPATSTAVTTIPSATATTVPATSTAVPTSTPTTTTTSANVALGRPAVSSSSETTTLTPNLTVDGNSSSRWSSQFSDPQWIYVDLGQAYAISRVRLSWETAYGKAYQIQVSNDAVNWTTAYSTSTGTGGISDLTLSGNGRYVRVYGTARGTVWGYSLWEFEVYGTSAFGQLPLSTPTPTATTVAPAPTATATAIAPSPTATAVPPTPTTVPAGSTMPLGQSSGWVMSFDDEFNGTSLDASKWVTCYPWYNPATGCTNDGNNESQWYVPGGVSVSNGTLKLTAQKQTVTGTNGKTYNYTSGMVSTGASLSNPPKFSYQYGFIEARMKLPAGKALWPAFWTLPNDKSWPPEVDGMEFWGQNTTQIMQNYHYKDASGALGQAVSFVSGTFTTQYHTFGVSWTPSSIVWYVDGVATKTFSNSSLIAAKPMYMILNLAIDGSNPPDSSTVFPAVTEVDYVRAWHQ